VHIPEVLVPFMGGITFLPFVRESRIAPTDGKSAKVAVPPLVKAEPAKPVEKAAAVAIEKKEAPAISDLAAQIVTVGDEIRTLKANKVCCLFNQQIDNLFHCYN
jgi:hypothetical protein